MFTETNKSSLLRFFLGGVCLLDFLVVSSYALPFPASKAYSYEGLRFLFVLICTLLLFGAGLLGFWFSRRGVMLKDVSICLVLLPLVHFCAFGASEGLRWIPLVLGFFSVLFTSLAAWKNT